MYDVSPSMQHALESRTSQTSIMGPYLRPKLLECGHAHDFGIPRGDTYWAISNGTRSLLYPWQQPQSWACCSVNTTHESMTTQAPFNKLHVKVSHSPSCHFYSWSERRQKWHCSREKRYINPPHRNMYIDIPWQQQWSWACCSLYRPQGEYCLLLRKHLSLYSVSS